MNRLDKAICQFDLALKTSFAAAPVTPRQHPAKDVADIQLDAKQRQHVGGLMRINHTGEVCAQALYAGQAATASDPEVRLKMQRAAEEETDHLYWCESRLKELNSPTSVLNPFWYASSWLIGAGAGLIGDKWSLGFVIETEHQVEAHLEEHLHSLPENDLRSRAIVQQMKEDEIQHAHMAEQAGGAELPPPVQIAMKFMADTMKALVYKI